MEEDKSNLVRKIFSSEVFKEADEAGKEEIIQQIVNTGEISKEETYISYLESLPYDVFVNVILAGDIKGKDLIYLCNSSHKLREYCHRSLILPTGQEINQYLFRRLVEKRRPGVPIVTNPRHDYELLTIIRYDDFVRLKYLLEQISQLTHMDDFENLRPIFDFQNLPGTLEDLLYEGTGQTISLLIDLQLDPSLADFQSLELIKVVLNAAVYIVYQANIILKEELGLTDDNAGFDEDLIDINSFIKRRKISMEQLLNLMLEKSEKGEKFRRFGHNNPLFKLFYYLGQVHPLITIQEAANILTNLEGYYRLILINSLPKDEITLNKLVKEKLLIILNSMFEITEMKEQEAHEEGRQLDQEDMDVKNRILKIKNDLETGVYEHVIDYVVELHKKIINGKLSVLTPFDWANLNKTDHQ